MDHLAVRMRLLGFPFALWAWLAMAAPLPAQPQQQVQAAFAAAAAGLSVTKIGTATATNNTVSSVAITLTGGAASGGLVVAVFHNAGSAIASPTCTDSGGAPNSYSVPTNCNQLDTGNGAGVILFTASVAHALTTSNTITVGGLPTNNRDFFFVVYSTSLYNSVDVSNGTVGANSTSHDTGTTGAQTGTNNITLSAGINYTSGTLTNTWAGSTALDSGQIGSRDYFTAWKNTITGTQQGTWTTGTCTASAGAIVSIK